jgi:hypothetical protein
MQQIIKYFSVFYLHVIRIILFFDKYLLFHPVIFQGN